ncbi:MAG: hypothetical protein COB37_04935 [Kordiimonadales bacterium]|nr:MAG: hypothetical protein COB37_04935 [Kordiimonadales bacterium]
MTEVFALLDDEIVQGMEREVGSDMLPILLQSLRNEIVSADKAMTAYLAEDEIALLRNQAHALKSAARSFGMLQLGEACFDIESAATGEVLLETIETLLVAFREVANSSLEKLDRDWL